MAKAVIKHTYELKRGQEEALDRVNPLLLRGEPVVVYREDGTTNIKVGDGVHNYKDLPFITKLPEMTQSNWDEKDTNSPDYIPGKPMSKTVLEKIFDVNYNINNKLNDDSVVFIRGPKLGLELGKKYIVDGVTVTNNNIQFECVATQIELPGFGNVTILSDSGNECIDSNGQINCNYFILADNIVLGNNSTPTYGDGSVIIMMANELTQVTVKELYSREVTLEYDEDYLPILQSDFEEGNPESPSYIKNKPLYTEYREYDALIISVDNVTLNSDSVGIYNGSFGLVKDRKYTVNMTDGNDYLYDLETRVVDDFSEYPYLSELTIPQGSLVLMVNLDDNWQPLLLQNITINETVGAFEYNDSYSTVFVIDQSVILEVYGEGLGPTRIPVTKKLDNKYLNLDQEFDGTSENAQSGIAIQQKLNQYTRNISVTTTLDDGYIRVSPTTQLNDGIITKDYNIYTQGLGKREELQTKNKNTLVDAINELTYEDIKFTSNDVVLTTPQQHYLLKNTITSVPSLTYSQSFTNSDSYVYVVPVYKYQYPELKALAVDFTNKVIYSITTTGITKSYDISGDFIDTINSYGQIKFVDAEYCEYSGNWILTIKVITYSTDGVYRLHEGQLKNNTIEPTMAGTTIIEIPSGVDFNNGYRHNFRAYSNSSMWQHQSTANALPSYSVSPGKLYYLSLTSSTIQSVGDDSYSNLKVFTTGKNTTYRALNSEGVEVINGIVKGYDNNVHSNYCRDSSTSSDVMCITSANEIISRDYYSGVINKVIKLKTDVNGIFGSLPSLKLINVSNLLYVLFNRRLYVIDLEEQEPEMIEVAIYGDSFIHNNKYNVLFFANDYGTIFMSEEHTSCFYINILRELFDQDDPINYDIEYIFDGGNAPIE